MKVIFDDGKEIEFDENEVGTLQDPRERIFKKDGIWYITKIINKDFAKWLDETKPMIIEEKKIPEKIEIYEDEEGYYFIDKHCKKIYITCDEINFMVEEFNQLIDYLQSKGE